MGRYYKEYADFLAEHFPGRKMQKLTVDAGFSCPNRDGTLSTGGCAYCNNNSFSPGSHEGRHLSPVADQLEESKIFFRRKYPSMRSVFSKATPTPTARHQDFSTCTTKRLDARELTES